MRPVLGLCDAGTCVQRMLDASTAGMEADAKSGELAALPVSPHDFSARPSQLLYSVRAAFFSQNAERCASCVQPAHARLHSLRMPGCADACSFQRSSVPAAANFLKVVSACVRDQILQRLTRQAFVVPPQQSARWSPDGSCLLTNSDDNALRLFDVPADALVRPSRRCHAHLC